ncbi:CopG family ribbon-helix-helix protein [Halococcoides cellulosivorans]|uniref:Putative nickel-responsive regulator n=1 Tax=Halococcoides cellulosivorans TaxID=1679096 RepID=A0A2R4WXL6_9EURY|nr:CopG family ribbon-helix-helix protein [Halococcoides cellulosivorans]AWB26278.1 nickel-responsive transcriptional regulator NikR [Halococcoides cellulosivorans]
MPIVSVSMPDGLVERLDQFAAEHGYSGRSEVIRDASRELLDEFDDQSLEGRDLMATVTVLFDYQAGEVEREMMDIRHEFDGVVASNFHTHVGDRSCLELFVLEGSLEAISTVVGAIRATSDVQTVSYSVLPMDDGNILVE